MRLVAVVVTHNRLEKLKKCIEKTLSESVQIVVVDNNSTDGTKEWLDSLADTRIFVHRSPKNIGGAGGFAIGMKIALRHFNPDWLVCFDDDAYPQQGALASFLAADKRGMAVAAAAVYTKNDEICEMNRPSMNPFSDIKLLIKTMCSVLIGRSHEQFHITDSCYQASDPMQIDVASFVGFFIRGSVVSELGFPREELFIYGDDVLYSLLLNQNGKKMYFLPTVKFVHECETYREERCFTLLWKGYYLYRNGIEIYRQYSGNYFALIVLVKSCGWLLLTARLTNKKHYAKMVLSAVYDGIFRRFDKTNESILAKYGSMGTDG